MRSKILTCPKDVLQDTIAEIEICYLSAAAVKQSAMRASYTMVAEAPEPLRSRVSSGRRVMKDQIPSGQQHTWSGIDA